MSLLEDVFLQDEAGEAQELERIIEGDEYEERQRQSSDSDKNSEKEDEAVEDKRRVDPASTKTKRVAKNPRFVLNPAQLTGPRGISVIPEHFKDFKFKGKGHEKEDLDLVLKKLEHWAYRLYPKFKFEDCLKKIETLGKKRVVSVHLQKIRSDQLITGDTVVQKDSSDEEELAVPLPQEDEFDQLLQQQIDLARATPAHGETRSAFSTPVSINKRSPLNTMMPKATSSPSISDEQKERMIRNRKLAEERRLARLKAASSTADGNSVPTVDLTNVNMNRNELPTVADEVEDVMNISNEQKKAKKNKSNVIDSSDDDNQTINESVTVDIHGTGKQNTIDLTEHDNQTQRTFTGKEKDNEHSGVQMDAASKTINLTGDFENPRTINQKILDLTEVQVLNSIVTNNKDNMEIAEAVSIDRPDTYSQNMIDLTEVQAHRNSIRNFEEDGSRNKRSNFVVSSDDEDDAGILVINEDIVVDVHKGNTNNISDKINADNEKNDIITDAEENKIHDVHKQQSIAGEPTIISEMDDVTKTSVVTNKISEIEMTDSVKNDAETEIVPDSGVIDNTTSITQKSQENTKEVDVSSEVNHSIMEETKKAESNNSNVGDVLDDLMDVDFSEDFV